MRQKFIKGSVANGHSGVEANTLFEQILKFANYGFNKSHAVAYAMIACKEAYLKANYPIEFYCAILDQQYGSNDTKFSRYLAEIRSSKLKVYLPNINESTLRFEMWNNGLLMPLLGINNLPSRVIISIIQEREKHGSYDSFINFVIRMTYFDEKISDTVLAKLIDAGAFDTLHSNRKALKMSIPNAIQYASMVKSSEGKLLNDFGIEYHIPEVIDDPIERLDNECAAVGVMISDSPLNHLPDELKNLKHTLIGDLKVGQTTTIVGIVRSIKNIVVKNGKDKGKPMAFVTIFDESGDVDTTFFSSIWSTVVSDIEINKIIVISGRYEMRNNLGNFLVPTGSMEPTIMPKDRLFGNMVVYKFRKPERNEIIVFKEPIQNKVLYTKRVMGLPGEKVALKDNHLYINDQKLDIREYSSLGQLGEDGYWIVPKKGDVIEVIPGANYGEYVWSKAGQPIDVAEVQKQLVANPGAVAQILPDLEFRVNGVKTGMVLDIIHDSNAVKKIFAGEKVTVVADEDYYLALGDNTNGSYDSRMWGFVKESRIKGKAFIRFWPLNRISLLK